MTAPNKPITVPDFHAARGVRKLAVVTAYDFTSAVIADAAGVDAILVGDSLGMVVQGHGTSLPVSMAEMLYHLRCVRRGTKRALIVADLPFLSYQVSPRQAVKNAGKMLKAGAHAVKLEGGERMADAIAACVRADIPVMGHIGLTPQSVHRMGGFKVQRDAEELLADAKAVQAAGAFSLVVEGVPTELGAKVTSAVNIPTIGIGAGPHCDGQVLVWHDLLGLYDGLRPKFVKRYAELGALATDAVAKYCDEVRTGVFPAAEHGFK
ncbi:MAG: 3-methyl-2-oxobutanoate hydroxymethyltransferase [Fimbriiglobus sp.]|jgi:3-methyl-2-oxobutanoate hydroxymethyltransferase|nr:3-methyl-2-oxobutanoate hydroxymethyltransferase [Fimbriiglobus sp.]